MCVCRCCRTDNNVRDPCREEGPQALISEVWSEWAGSRCKLVSVFDALGSERLRSIGELVDFIYYYFQGVRSGS